jgi:GGDEF domain-containing protein
LDWTKVIQTMGLEMIHVGPRTLNEEAFYRFPCAVIWASEAEPTSKGPGLFPFPSMLPVWTASPAARHFWTRHVGYEGPLPEMAGPNEQLRLERGIRRYLFHRRAVDLDPLTSLPNRPCFESWLQRAMYWKPNQDWFLGFVDVLDMTDTNRFQGYVAGDRKLRQFARILAAHLPADAPHCRWGGDEFLIAVNRSDWRPPSGSRSALCPLGSVEPAELQRLVDRLHDRLRTDLP